MEKVDTIPQKIDTKKLSKIVAKTDKKLQDFKSKKKSKQKKFQRKTTKSKRDKFFHPRKITKE